MVPTVVWEDGAVVMIDQRRLPGEQVFLRCRDHHEVAAAIKDMAIRGAPAIGVAAALGLALGARTTRSEGASLHAEWNDMCATLAATRPTAVNLFWAIERMRQRFRSLAPAGGETLRHGLLDEVLAIRREDLESCRRMGDLGAELLPAEARVLTHCNAGALATAGYGTALGVIRSAARTGRLSRVLAQETRPFLQGARLTTWELARDGIPVTLVTDGMGGALMARGDVDAIVVGADRIAANGDVANKIGTYTLAVLAHAHGLPFYVAAPLSTLDLQTPTGKQIPIEQRSSDEVTRFAGVATAAAGVTALHPAFDVTPATLVTAIVTERGVLRPPYGPGLAAQRRESEGR